LGSQGCTLIVSCPAAAAAAAVVVAAVVVLAESVALERHHPI